MPFRPTIESAAVPGKKFLTECSVKKFLRGDFNKGPHMLGFTADEAITFGDGKIN